MVKWFNDAKGFGFIEPQGGGGNLVAHFSAVQMVGVRTLSQAELVDFDLVRGPTADMAENIWPAVAHVGNASRSAMSETAEQLSSIAD